MDGAKIFHRFAGAFDTPVLNLLERFVVGQGVDRLDVVASVLREAPEVTFDNVDFVTKLLRLAAKHGEKHLQLVGGALHGAAVSGFGSAAIGQPFPRDVTLRGRAEATAETLPVGSIEARFYSSLAESARRNIEWQTQSGEKLLDGRDWG